MKKKEKKDVYVSRKTKELTEQVQDTSNVLKKAKKLGRDKSEARLNIRKQELEKKLKSSKGGDRFHNKARDFNDKLQMIGSNFAKRKVLGTARAKIPSINALKAITPRETIALVREAQKQNFNPQPTPQQGNGLFFNQEFIHEKTKMKNWLFD